MFSSVLKKDEGINTLIFPKKPAKHLPFILLIEDNPIALKVAESVAKQTHCQVLTASTGEDAFELVKAQRFDFIVSDIGLPGMSGIELTKAIRSWEKKVKKTATPIIDLTAHLLPESMLHCIEMGMNKVLQKPLHIEMMQSLINLFIPSKK